MEITDHSIIIWVTAVIIGSLALVILLGSKRLSSRTFAFSIFWVMAWSTTLGIFESLNIAVDGTLLSRTNFYFGTVIIVSFFYFFLTYPQDSHPNKKLARTLVIIEGLLAYIYLGTNLIITSAGKSDLGIVFWKYGTLSWIFEIEFIGMLIAGILVLYKKYKATKDRNSKVNLGYMLAVISTGFIPPTIFSAILPRFGYFDLNWLGPVTGIIWVSIMAYSIVKYRQMNVRIFTAEVLVIAMGIITFINIFTDFSFGVYGRIASFLAFVALGYFLIKNIMRVSTQREELDKLNNELSYLNTGLQKKVDEQTKEVKKAYEVEKKAHTELQRLDQNKNDFIIITQHHLRTPLTQIRWYANSLLSGLYGNLAPESAETVSRIDATCGKLAKILNDFLEIVQLKIETKILKINPTNVMGIIDILLQEYSPEIQKHRLSINMPQDDAEWPLVQADENRLKDALSVVIDNAIRYNSDGGKITIRTEKSLNALIIHISNTGVGLKDNERQDIFKQSFFRSRKAKEVNPLGMGVGLLVAQTILTSHGGSIKLENTPENITSFAINLPLSK